MYYSTNPDSVTTQQNYSKGSQQTELKVLYLCFATLKKQSPTIRGGLYYTVDRFSSSAPALLPQVKSCVF